MLRSQKTAITSLVLVFLFGIFCGIASERFVFNKIDRQHKKRRESLEQKFTRELELNEDQVVQLKTLFKETKKKHHDIRKLTDSMYDSVRVDFDMQLNGFLDQDQQLKFAQLQEEWRQRKEKERLEKEARDKKRKEKAERN